MRTFPTLYKKTAGDKVQEWTIAVRKEKDGSGTILIDQGLVDGKKQHYEDHVTEGKNAGRRNATSAYEQAVAEAESRWNRQKDRRHYGTDVEANESAAKRALAPMLAQKYEDHAGKVDWSSAMAQPKLDGDRITARKEDGEVTLWSRKGEQIVSIPHVAAELKKLMKNHETFDGEGYIHGEHVTRISGMLRLKRPEPRTEKISFRVYDFVWGEPFDCRFAILHSRLQFHKSEVVTLVNTIHVPSEAELMKFQADCLAEGFEGAMLRWGQTGYEAGKRSKSLLKVKTFKDSEFKIVDVVPSDKQFNLTLYGPDDEPLSTKPVRVAVLVCQLTAGHRFQVTAPGTIAEKHAILQNADDYIGRKVTVKYQNFTDTEEPVPFQPVAKAILD